MTDSTEKQAAPADISTSRAPAGYEAPRVERVLTQETLDQEALYAGGTSVPEL
jgi:hypothetical protein